MSDCARPNLLISIQELIKELDIPMETGGSRAVCSKRLVEALMLDRDSLQTKRDDVAGKEGITLPHPYPLGCVMIY
jgi:hypothetical protein